MSITSVFSALAWIAPEDDKTGGTEQIQLVRKKHDKQFNRWMAHVNFLFPFLSEEEFKDGKHILADALATVSEFELEFSKFGHFKESGTIFLEPVARRGRIVYGIDDEDNPLQVIHRLVLSLFPQLASTPSGKRKFKPHLTIKQVKDEKEAQEWIKKFKADWEDVKFKVDRISWLTRTDSTPFKVAQSFHLAPDIINAIGDIKDVKDAKDVKDVKGIKDIKSESKDVKSESKNGIARYFKVSDNFGSFVELEVKRRKANKAKNLIFILDSSASMTHTSPGDSKQPWEMVCDVMKQIHGVSPNHRVIVYSTEAKEYKLSEFVKSNIDADGATHFSSVFDAIVKILKQAKDRNETEDYVFCFMTDGEDTSNNNLKLNESTANLVMTISELKFNTCFHSLAFGPKVDEKFLNAVINLGSETGTFRYANKTENLGANFFDIFDISQATLGAELRFGPMRRPVILVQQNNQEVKDVKEAKEAKDSKRSEDYKSTYVMEEIIPNSFFSNLSSSSMAERKLQMLQIVLDGEVYPFTLEFMPRVSSMMRLKALQAIQPRNEEDAANILKEIRAVPEKASGILERIKVRDLKQELYNHFSNWLSSFNEQKTKKLTAESSLKLSSLKYQHIFNKARRNRSVELRTQANLSYFEVIDEKLKRLYTITFHNAKAMEEIKALTAKNDWQCALSLTTPLDLWTGESCDDFLCIGVRVQRDELVIDSPTLGLRLLDTSSTILSYNSFIESMDKAVAERGDKAAHGGFTDSKKVSVNPSADPNNGVANFSEHNEAYCCVGTAREKINAVIPLFLHPSHYERVKATKRMWLANFFTLNPFSYEKNQEVAFLALLGEMIQRFNGTEFQAKIIEQLSLIANDFLMNSPQFIEALPENRMKEFIDKPTGRQRQYFPSLIVPLTVGYLKDRYSGDVQSYHTSTSVNSKNSKYEKDSKDSKRENSKDSKYEKDIKDSKDSKCEKDIKDSKDSKCEKDIKDMKDNKIENENKKFIDRSTDGISSILSLVKPAYYEFVKRTVRDNYSNNKIEAHKIAKRLLYYVENDSDSKGSSKKKGKPPIQVQIDNALEEFAEWFENSRSVSSIPRLPDVGEVKSFSKSSEDSDVKLSISPSCNSVVSSLLPEVPLFIINFVMKSQQLLYKISENYADVKDSKDIKDSKDGKDGKEKKDSKEPIDGDKRILIKEDVKSFILPRTDKEFHEARCHLLLSYFFFNEYPPESITENSVIEHAHTKFQQDAENANKNIVRAEECQRIANIIVECENLSAFGGLLKIYCPTRNGIVFDRVIDGLIRNEQRDKLIAILSNQVRIYDDLDGKDKILYDGKMANGDDFENAVWIPINQAQLDKIAAIVGKDEITRIEADHRNNRRTTHHIYRESNIENRHGHSNLCPNSNLSYRFSRYNLSFY